MRSNTAQYFRGKPLSGGVKARIKKLAVAKATANGLAGVLTHSIGPLNRAKREVFADAIFEVENDLESQGGGRPDHPTVVALRAVRNEVYDDLGWNEYPKRKSA